MLGTMPGPFRQTARHDQHGSTVTSRVRPRPDLLPWELAAGVCVQVVLLALLWASVGLGLSGWLAGSAYAVVGCAILSHAFRRAGSHALGPANRVTLARATLIGGVTALAVPRLGERAPVVFVVLAAVALILDTVDGRVARRTGTSSELGARFDIEADAFLVLVLSVFVAATLGHWVLAIGCMRYLFVAAAWVAPWLRAPLFPSLARKYVGVLQGIALLVVSAGVLPRGAAFALVALALVLLVWSFGRDTVWLWQRRQPA